jgi:hypothetical protein
MLSCFGDCPIYSASIWASFQWCCKCFIWHNALHQLPPLLPMVIWQPMSLITYVCCHNGFSFFFFMMWMLQIWIAQIDRFCIGCNTSSINRLLAKVQIHETLNTCSCGVGSGFVLDSVVTWTCMHKQACGPIGACINNILTAKKTFHQNLQFCFWEPLCKTEIWDSSIYPMLLTQKHLGRNVFTQCCVWI